MWKERRYPHISSGHQSKGASQNEQNDPVDVSEVNCDDVLSGPLEGILSKLQNKARLD